MKKTTQHLLHLAAAALFLYAFALVAKTVGATVAAAVLLPLAIGAELTFWIKLLKPGREGSPGGEA